MVILRMAATVSMLFAASAAMQAGTVPMQPAAAATGKAAASAGAANSDQLLADATALIDDGVDMEQARRLLDQVQKADPRNVRAHVQRARYDLVGGHVDRGGFVQAALDHADAELAQALDVDPGNADVLVLLGKLREDQHRQEEAIEVLAKARAIGTHNPWLYLNAYDAYAAVGQWDLAADSLRALDDDPAVHAAIVPRMLGVIAGDRGLLLQHRRDLPALEAWWRRKLDAEPGAPGVLADHAMYLLQFRDDIDGAMAEARKARATVDFDIARRNLGLAQYAKWAQLREKSPSEADGYRRLARENLGDYGEALGLAAERLGDSKALQAFALAAKADGASLDARDSDGFTPLDYAVMCGCMIEVASPTSMAWLLDHGARIDARDGQQQTALMWATARGIRPAVEVLVARGADLDARTPANGLMAIHMAARQGDTGMLRILLAHGAGRDSRDLVGMTPLMYAARTGAVGAVRFLLDAGADPAAVDQKGETAEQIAAGHGNAEVARLLHARAKP